MRRRENLPWGYQKQSVPEGSGAEECIVVYAQRKGEFDLARHRYPTKFSVKIIPPDRAEWRVRRIGSPPGVPEAVEILNYDSAPVTAYLTIEELRKELPYRPTIGSA